MSRSNRRDGRALLAHAIIVGGAVIASAFSFIDSRLSQPIHDQGAEEHAAEEKDNHGPASGIGATGFDPWRENWAQWTMAIFAVVATGTGFVGLFWIRQTLNATRKGNKINRDIGKAQVRAYVEIEKASVMFRRPFSFFDRYRPEVWVDVANHGSSPALDYRWDVEISYGYTDAEGTKFLGPAPVKGEGINIPATGKPLRLKREVTHDVLGTAERALNAGGLRVFVTVRSLFTDVFDDNITRALHFVGDVKKTGEHAFGCDLTPFAQDDDAARKYGTMLRVSIDTIDAFNRNLRDAAEAAERAIAEGDERDDDPREPT